MHTAGQNASGENDTTHAAAADTYCLSDISDDTLSSDDNVLSDSDHDVPSDSDDTLSDSDSESAADTSPTQKTADTSDVSTDFLLSSSG